MTTGVKTSTTIQPPPATTNEHMLFATHPHAARYSATLSAGLGSFRHPSAKLAAALREIGYYDIPDEVMQIMCARKREFSPERWARIRPFVEDAVAVTAPQTTRPATHLRSAAAGFVDWAVTVQRLPLDGDVIWSRQLIDLYVTNEHTHLSEGTRRNYRSYLDRISRVLSPEEHPYEYTPQNRKGTQPPYSHKEMIAFRQWAVGQSKMVKRHRAMLMLALCAGAGLSSSEVALLCAENIVVTRAGITIDVPGNRPRRVPLMAIWDEWILAILEERSAGESLWGASTRQDGTSLLSNFAEKTEGTGPRSDRLRNTWLVGHLRNRVPMKDLFYAAGVTKMEHLGRLLIYCEDLPESDYLTIFRGEAAR